MSGNRGTEVKGTYRQRTAGQGKGNRKHENMRTGGYGARQVVGGLGTEKRIGLQETGEHGAGGYRIAGQGKGGQLTGEQETENRRTGNRRTDKRTTGNRRTWSRRIGNSRTGKRRTGNRRAGN